MSGTLSVESLRIDCVVGVYARERTATQSLLLDFELDVDLQAAVETDNVSETVDYAAVSEFLTEWSAQQRFKLIETLAWKASGEILNRWPSVSRCKLRVRKPGALATATHAAVTVERSRS